MSDYPNREAYYAQKFIRLLTKSAAAQDLGPSVCWMLSVIACQEDAKRYTEPAKWYHEQLMPLCGFRSPKQLTAAIKKAERLGWLKYVPGRKGIPCRFSVEIPSAFSELGSSGCDESRFASESEVKAEVKVQRKRKCKGIASIPTPIPIPIEIDSPDFRKSWDEWLRHLSEKNTKTTPSAFQKQLAKCVSLGQARAITAIEHSIAGSYQSIFEPSTNGFNQPRPPQKPHPLLQKANKS